MNDKIKELKKQRDGWCVLFKDENEDNNRLREYISELKDSLKTISGFYACDLKEEKIDPMSCPNYRKAVDLLEKEL